MATRQRFGRWAALSGLLTLGLTLACDPPRTGYPPIPPAKAAAQPRENLLIELTKGFKPCRPGSVEALKIHRDARSAGDDLHHLAYHHEAAAERLQALGFPCLAVDNLNRQGQALRKLRKVDQARHLYLRQALPEARSAGFVRGAAQTLNNLAVLERGGRNLRQALDYFQAASYLFAYLDDRRQWTLVQLNLGEMEFRLGRLAAAHARLESAAERFRQAADDRYLAAALTWLGRTEIALGLTDSDDRYRRLAITRLREAVGLRRRADSGPLALGTSLDGLGRAFLEDRQYREAESALQEAELLFSSLQADFSTANVQVNLAAVRLGQALPAEALALVDGVLGQPAPTRLGLAEWNVRNEALLINARAQLSLGNRDLASVALGQAIALFEVLRTDNGSLMDSALALRKPAVDLYLELLIDDRRWPEAFDLIELHRARSLLDRLLFSPREVLLRSGAPQLLAQYEELRADLLQLAATLPEPRSDPVQHLDLELRQLLHRLLAIEEEIREKAQMRSATPLRRHQAEDLLVPGSLFVGYWLGAQRSWVFILEHGREDQVLELSVSRSLIESSVEELRRELARGNGSSRRAKNEASFLSSRLLEPIAERLIGAERLVLLVDGPLMALPYAALPSPLKGDTLLVDSLPLVKISSVSTLMVLRQRQAARRHEQKHHLTIFSDPSYDLENSWPRIEGTRQEAESIRRFFPTDRVYLGSAASRENLLAGVASDSRWIHIASHGTLDVNHPELSRLRLATLDEHGHAIDGRLHLTDLNQLRLSASLVVLSGCETAIGQPLRGSGPLAFPSAFLYAGAAGVIASLWPVDDQATVALMTELYRGLGAGLDPPRALQQAQRSMSRGKYYDPAYWAAWAFVGDWQG